MTNIAYMDALRRHLTRIRHAVLIVAVMAVALSSSGKALCAEISTPDHLQQDAWRVTYVVRPSLETGSVGITAVLMGDVAGGVVWRHADIRTRRSTQSRPEAQDGFGQALRVAGHP